MNNTTIFSCKIGTTDAAAAIGMEIWLDQEQIFNVDHVKKIREFTHEVDDVDAEHELQFRMKNKTVEHTRVDEGNNIVHDASLTITDIAFEEIDLGHMLVEQAVYTHDFNGTQPEIKDTFFGEMGCNGTVSLRFTTPIYLWFLEHM
jgi:hypothetical protein